MGYLSSAIGKPVKWIGGAAALYGGYKLAKNNGDDIKNSLGGAFEGLENGDSMDAVYGFLDSTNEQIDQNPEYGANLGTAGKGLAAAVIGAYLDGSFSSQEMAIPEVEPQRHEDQNDPEEPFEEQEEVIPGYTQLGTVNQQDEEYMLLRSTDDDSEIYSIPMNGI
ncbi:MAG: hypothetical protein BRC30_02840 [Nanohaloarchaea archaeon SW_7_46_7]|nr:MAG: hypothetical protein BRC30_02840 [Nanohaloarchaea archaeon SW_7_46_7]